MIQREIRVSTPARAFIALARSKFLQNSLDFSLIAQWESKTAQCIEAEKVRTRWREKRVELLDFVERIYQSGREMIYSWVQSIVLKVKVGAGCWKIKNLLHSVKAACQFSCYHLRRNERCEHRFIPLHLRRYSFLRCSFQRQKLFDLEWTSSLQGDEL